MNFYSLNHQSSIVDFKQATVAGQAPDKGLYFPAEIPVLSKSFIQQLSKLSKEEIGFTVLKPFVGESIDDEALQQIVKETINFSFPLVQVTQNIFSLELYHGPTLAFKDVGARFMSRCLGYFNQHNNKQVTVLVATSGDTGGAVADGFLGVEGVEVIILYPKNKVSPVQELQLTTLGQNITAVEVDGNFDDCQAMVKQAFTDTDITSQYQLTSANSINVARWLPQQLYYFFALQQWQQDNAPVICVPSGNFGNICAGILAWASGLPVAHFIAACNANDTVTKYLQTQKYLPKQAVATVSNAMDVANPSNFVRVLEIFKNHFPALQNMLSSVSITDDVTKQTISAVYKETGYTLDPHGAVAYIALQQHLKKDIEEKGIFLETAHPVKFPDVVEEAINNKIEIPASVQHLFAKQKQAIVLENNFTFFKQWMLSRGN